MLRNKQSSNNNKFPRYREPDFTCNNFITVFIPQRVSLTRQRNPASHRFPVFRSLATK